MTITAPNLDGALCVHRPDLFTVDPKKNQKHAKAKAICGHCPVQQKCLSWALSDHTLVGILGGTTYAERRRMARWRQEHA